MNKIFLNQLKLSKILFSVSFKYEKSLNKFKDTLAHCLMSVSPNNNQEQKVDVPMLIWDMKRKITQFMFHQGRHLYYCL